MSYSYYVMLSQLVDGFWLTLQIFFFTLLGALPLGMIVYFCKRSKFLPLKWFVSIYISVMRGTPLMLQLMVVYYGPGLMFNVLIPGNWRFNATIIAFILNYAAYFAEIYRGGIESISLGQYEAAQVLGYNKLQTFFKIVMPQMFKTVLPSITNEVITLVKDTSLASVIGIIEMFTVAEQIANAPRSPGMMTFVAAAIFYYGFNYLVAFTLGRIEKALSYYR